MIVSVCPLRMSPPIPDKSPVAPGMRKQLRLSGMDATTEFAACQRQPLGIQPPVSGMQTNVGR